VNSIFAAVTIIVLSVFMVGGGRGWLRKAAALQPPERAAMIDRTVDRMAIAVGNYVAGAIAQATIAGISTFIVLTILGVPFAAPLSVVVFFFDLVPLVGATIAAIVVGVVTVFVNFPTATIVWVIWAVIYQQVENNVIQPQIQKRALDIHPFVVLVSVLFGSALFGVAGALLAIPVAASAQIATLEWWRFRHGEAGPLETPGTLPPPPAPAEG
jgi:predicted PurR-regulated permease PerM